MTFIGLWRAYGRNTAVKGPRNNAEQPSPNTHTRPLATGLQLQRRGWFEGDRYETLTICRSLALAHAAFAVAGRGDGLSLNANWLFG
jgi:hypothetical protein